LRFSCFRNERNRASKKRRSARREGVEEGEEKSKKTITTPLQRQKAKYDHSEESLHWYTNSRYVVVRARVFEALREHRVHRLLGLRLVLTPGIHGGGQLGPPPHALLVAVDEAQRAAEKLIHPASKKTNTRTRTRKRLRYMSSHHLVHEVSRCPRVRALTPQRCATRVCGGVTKGDTKGDDACGTA
jgi:hypothetical protein